MGNSSAKPLEYGAFKVTGAELHDEGVVVLIPGELEIGKSKDITFKFSSEKEGVFRIVAKYMGMDLKELEFDHADVITLLHETETSREYQAKAAALGYIRPTTSLSMGRAFVLDCTKLLPYLYEKFRLQNLEVVGAKLVQAHQSGNGGSAAAIAATAKATAASKKKVPGSAAEMDRLVHELEVLEKSMRSG